jgi:tetratricopeptide (TPR) repeat protein
LATAIGRSRSKDIAAAYRLDIIDEKEPHKILEKSYSLLSATEKKVAAALAVFRGTFSFDPAKALFKEMEEDRLWAVLQDLCRLGFLFYSEKEDRFDFHPILRSFLYRNLTGAGKVHDAAVHYFRALPKPEKIISLEDLVPVIELYHHLVKAGKYDEAFKLFRNRIASPIYYQLSAYPLCIELLRELFPDGVDRQPRLKTEAAQAWTLNSLANSYALSGQPAQAVSLFLQCIRFSEKNADKKNISIPQGNVAQFQLILGKLSAACAHLQKSISLCREIKEAYQEAIGHALWGWGLACQGRGQGNANAPGAEEELSLSTKYWEKKEDYQGLSIVSANRSLGDLVQGRLESVLKDFPGIAGEHKVHPYESPGIHCRSGSLCPPTSPGIRPNYSGEALAQAHQALAYAEKTAQTRHPVPRDFVQAYWLLGEALVQLYLHGGETPGAVVPPGLAIPFYDDYFRQVQETLAVQPGRELIIAERCLQEALRRCRTINLVEFEPDILLALVRLDWAGVHTQPPQERAKHLPALADPMQEAHDLARRCGYRLVLADIHLFCGQALLECQCPETTQLLGLTAPQHLQKTKDYAQDDSAFADLYQSPDPDFYKGIPEYELLKRGLSPEERIRNGYFPVYQMAEFLEAALHPKE